MQIPAVPASLKCSRPSPLALCSQQPGRPSAVCALVGGGLCSGCWGKPKCGKKPRKILSIFSHSYKFQASEEATKQRLKVCTCGKMSLCVAPVLLVGISLLLRPEPAPLKPKVRDFFLNNTVCAPFRTPGTQLFLAGLVFLRCFIYI